MEVFYNIVEILSGLIVIIPLVIELVKYVKIAIKEKNWSKLVDIVLNLIIEAETKFDNGADKKEWVIDMVSNVSESINYDLDKEKLSKLIDDFVKMSKSVNTK